MANQKFNCWLCGGKSYKTIRKSGEYKGPPINFSDKSFIDHYECESCSVRFSDIDKFNLMLSDTIK